MDLPQLKKRVAQGEGERLEFKRKVAHPEKVVREVVAFANATGGTLIIGVEDNLNIAGLTDPDGEEYVLDKAIRLLCKPAISYRKERIAIGPDNFVLVYEIAEAEEKPCQALDGEEYKTYIRVGDRSVQASREVRQILKESRRGKQYQFGFGDKEKTLIDHLSRHHSITKDQFVNLGHVPARLAGRTLVLLVLAGVLNCLPGEGEDTFTLSEQFIEQARLANG